MNCVLYRVLAILLTCHLSLTTASAQQVKFGYLNFQEVIKVMPEYAQVQADMADLRVKYDAEMKRAEDEFNKKYEEFLEGQHDFAPSIYQKRQAELMDIMDKNIAFKNEARRLLRQAEQDARQPLKDKLKEMYEQYKRNNPPQEEMSAAHILLKTEKEAKDVIKQLEKGADFADLANKLSENKGLEGGDLGYFTRELMVPEFSEAVFRMKEGEISKTPVKTQFGYHVIKAGPRRLTEVPSFEEMEKELAQTQASEAVEEVVKGLRKDAKIVKTPVKFDAQGNIVK